MKRSHYIWKVIIIFCLALFGSEKLFAQENTVAMGGIAFGTGGSISFSIGQIDYETTSGSGGSITEGLQQPIEILTITGFEDNNINLDFEIYPNPTADFVVLNVDNIKTKNMFYIIYDIEGKLIEKQEVNGSQTTIAMKDLVNGIYFVKVLRKSTEVKIFKVIKNN